jgi:hypothetical protein
MKTTRISIVVAVMLLVITTSLSAVGPSELKTKTDAVRATAGEAQAPLQKLSKAFPNLKTVNKEPVEKPFASDCEERQQAKAGSTFLREALQLVALRKDEDGDLKELVSKTASQIPFLNINYVLYDRSIDLQVRELFTDEEHDAYETFRRLAKSTSDEKWLPLMYHNDAKVRTLAMSALYLRGDPKWLPKFVTMRNDTGKTFPEHQLNPVPKFFFVEVAPAERRKMESFREQTVGGFAKAIVRLYMFSGGYLHGIEGRRGQRGFDDYWKKRKDRDHCLGWFAVALKRASQGNPTEADRLSEIKRLREKIEAIAPPYRDYLLFALGTTDSSGSTELVPPDELTLVAKRLGPERLMDLLRGKSPTDDPDFVIREQGGHGGHGGFEYRAAIRYILKNREDLLRPADVDELLLIESRH